MKLPFTGKYAVVDHPIEFFFDPFSCRLSMLKMVK
jgi:hypothetical protein